MVYKLGYSMPKKKTAVIGRAVIEKPENPGPKKLTAEVGRAYQIERNGEIDDDELRRRRDALMNVRLATAAKERKKLTTTYLVKHGRDIAKRSRSY